MGKLIPVIIAILIISSCNNKHIPNSDAIIINGIISSESKKSDLMLEGYIVAFDLEMKTKPDRAGNFKFDFNVPTAIEFSFHYDSIFAYIPVKPGDSIFLEINLNKKDPITFHGNSSTFLNELTLVTNSLNLPLVSYDDKVKMYQTFTPQQYLKFRKNKADTDIKTLNHYAANNKLSNKTLNYLKTKINVEYGSDLVEFLQKSSLHQANDTIPIPYKNEIELLINSMNDFPITNDYINFLNGYSVLNVLNSKDFINSFLSGNKLHAEIIHMNSDIKLFAGIQKDYLLFTRLMSFIKKALIDTATFNKYLSEISHEGFKKRLKEAFNNFVYINNKTIDTSDFKLRTFNLNDTTSIFEILKHDHPGKIIYADIWATWCGSCIASFNNTKRLKTEINNSNFNIVYIAINSKNEMWKKIIKTHHLNGYHYLLNSTQEKELNNSINYITIPHHFIIGKSGIIIDNIDSFSEKELLKVINQELTP